MTGRDRKLRIMLLVPSLERGGTERQAVLIATKLAARGHSVTLVTFRSGGAFEAGLTDAGVGLATIAFTGFPWELGYFTNFARLLRRETPNALCSFLPPSNVIALMARLTVRDCRICWGVRSADMPLGGYSVKTKLAYFFEWLTSGFPDRIIVNSQAGLAACLRKGYPRQKLRVIFNGYDTEVFRPNTAARERVRAEFNITTDEIVIGLPARIDPIKDHETFLRAAAILARQNAKVRFICLGGGQKPLLERLHALTGELGLAGKVIWTGARGDMPDALNALDIATMCSLSEGFPNTVGEPMACGVPCVVTDVGDARFLVGDSGIVIAPRDPAALAAAWAELLDPARRARMGQAARSRIMAQFSLGRLADETEAVLAGRA